MITENQENSSQHEITINTEEEEEEESESEEKQLENIEEESYDDDENKFKKFLRKFSKQLPDNFFKQRKIGQNENYICKLIREDSIDEFITFVNQHNYLPNSNIERSIYETNSFLIKNKQK